MRYIARLLAVERLTLAERPLSLAIASVLMALGVVFVNWLDVLGVGQYTRQHTLRLFHIGNSTMLPAGENSVDGDIVIVLLVDDDLGNKRYPASETWPVGYGYHAAVLHALAIGKPSSIFVDIAFVEKRKSDSDGFDELSDTVYGIRQLDGIDLYFAASAFIADRNIYTDKKDEIYRGLHSGLSLGGKGAIPVAINAGIPADSYTSYLSCQELKEGPPLPSAAVAIAWGADVCRPSKDKTSGGKALPDRLNLLWKLTDCGDGGWNSLLSTLGIPELLIIADFVWNLVTSIDRSNVQRHGVVSPFSERCPPFPTYRVGDVLSIYDSNVEVERQLRTLLQGKTVMYGMELALAEDHISPPTMGQVPGVYLHAMALRNLRVFAEGPSNIEGLLQARDRSALFSWWQFELLAIAALSIFLTMIIHRWRERVVFRRISDHMFARSLRTYRPRQHPWGLIGNALLMWGIYVALSFAVIAIVFRYAWWMRHEPPDVIFLVGLMSLQPAMFTFKMLCSSNVELRASALASTHEDLINRAVDNAVRLRRSSDPLRPQTEDSKRGDSDEES